MWSGHSRSGLFHRSVDIHHTFSRAGKWRTDGALTYFEHDASPCANALGYIYGACMCGVCKNRKDLALETDWDAMVVFGFSSFAIGFGERMARVCQLDLIYVLENGRCLVWKKWSGSVDFDIVVY